MTISNSFLDSANEVLNMYSLRQKVAARKLSQHSLAEIEWCCHQLYALSGAAAYAGRKNESDAIKSATDYWRRSGNKPDSITR